MTVRFGRAQLIGGGLLGLLLCVVPLVYHQAYFLHIMSLAMIAATAALGMQLLLGFTGQLSMGQAAFFGIGAYTSGISDERLLASRSRSPSLPPGPRLRSQASFSPRSRGLPASTSRSQLSASQSSSISSSSTRNG